jgi:hypothetical protein
MPFDKFKIVLLTFLIFQVTTLDAQLIINSKTPKPKHYIKAGYGFVTSANFFRDEINSGEGSHFSGPLYFKYEYCIAYNLTLGIVASGESITYTTSGSGYYDYTTSSYVEGKRNEKEYESGSLLFRMNYILVSNPHMQPYIGMSVGVRRQIFKETFYYPEYSASYPYYVIGYTEHYEDGTKDMPGGEFVVGVNFLLKKGFGIYTETGIAKSYIQFGIVKCFGKNIP